MSVQSSDLLLVQRGGTQYKATVSSLPIPTLAKPDWNATRGSSSEILNRPNLSPVALSGRYSDLVGTPPVPPPYVLPVATHADLGGVKAGGYHIHIEADGKISARLPGALTYRGVIDATVDGPTIKGGATGLEAGDTYINTTDGVATSAWDGLSGASVTRHALIIFDGTIWQEAGDISVTLKPDWNAPRGRIDEILNKPALAPVATSGDYGDLINTPTLPVATKQLEGIVRLATDADINNGVSTVAVTGDQILALRTHLEGMVAAITPHAAHGLRDVSAPGSAPTNPTDGDIVIASKAGPVDPSFNGMANTNVVKGTELVYDATSGTWSDLGTPVNTPQWVQDLRQLPPLP